MKLTVGPQDRKASSKELIDLDFVGVNYKVRKIKTATAMKLGKIMEDEEGDTLTKIEAIEDLIERIFGKESPKVLARLEDPEDQLDFPHIAELMQAMMEATGGDENPTG